MQNLVIKIKNAIEKIEFQKGKFKLKCLVSKNSDYDMKWDLILSAEWFDSKREIERLNELSEIIFKDFSTSDLLDFSAIITYKTDEATPLIECLEKIQGNRNQNDSSNYGDDVQYPLNQCRGFERETVIFL